MYHIYKSKTLSLKLVCFDNILLLIKKLSFVEDLICSFE